MWDGRDNEKRERARLGIQDIVTAKPGCVLSLTRNSDESWTNTAGIKIVNSFDSWAMEQPVGTRLG
jgi:hypothetical protein